MALPKGISGNPKGRPKGKPNKVTAELKERIKEFLDDNFLTVTKGFKNLDDEKKLLIFEKFLSYVTPKQSQGSMNLNISKMSDDEINQLLNRLIKD